MPTPYLSAAGSYLLSWAVDEGEQPVDPSPTCPLVLRLKSVVPQVVLGLVLRCRSCSSCMSVLSGRPSHKSRGQSCPSLTKCHSSGICHSVVRSSSSPLEHRIPAYSTCWILVPAFLDALDEQASVPKIACSKCRARTYSSLRQDMQGPLSNGSSGVRQASNEDWATHLSTTTYSRGEGGLMVEVRDRRGSGWKVAFKTVEWLRSMLRWLALV